MSLDKALWWLTRHTTDPAIGYITSQDMGEAFKELFQAVFVELQPTLDELAKIKGEVGPEGPQGIQGPKGDTGAQGVQGPPGPATNMHAHVCDATDIANGVDPVDEGSLFVTNYPGGTTGLPFAPGNVGGLPTDIDSKWVNVGYVMGPVGLVTATHSSGPAPSVTVDTATRSLNVVFPEIPKIYTQSGIGTQAVQTITHALNTPNPLVTVYEIDGGQRLVHPGIRVVDQDNIELDLTSGSATATYTVIVRN